MNRPSTTTGRRQRIRERESQYPWFLVATLLPITITPLTSLDGNPLQRLLLPLATNFLILQSLRISPSQLIELPLAGGRWLYRALCAATAAVVWIPFVIGHHAPHSLHGPILSIICTFYTVTAVRLIQILAHLERVNWRSLCLGAGGYVQLGLTAGQLATWINIAIPGSFAVGTMLPGEEMIERMNYFAFVTLGGIGYGDVLPRTPLAEFFAVALNLAGTLYISLVIGLLLSRYINERVDAVVKQAEASATVNRDRE